MRPTDTFDGVFPRRKKISAGDEIRSPCLELVNIKEQDSFKVRTHGYPWETVRWHFHPEYELNFITETSGRFFVSDYTGTIAPGQLCVVGPNLPHNWVSELPDTRPDHGFLKTDPGPNRR